MKQMSVISMSQTYQKTTGLMMERTENVLDADGVCGGFER